MGVKTWRTNQPTDKAFLGVGYIKSDGDSIANSCNVFTDGNFIFKLHSNCYYYNRCNHHYHHQFFSRSYLQTVFFTSKNEDQVARFGGWVSLQLMSSLILWFIGENTDSSILWLTWHSCVEMWHNNRSSGWLIVQGSNEYPVLESNSDFFVLL